MTQILIGGDTCNARQLGRWLETWGLNGQPLDPAQHPAEVPTSRAAAVLYACGPEAPNLPQIDASSSPSAPLLLVGATTDSHLAAMALMRVADPGPGGEALATALRTCLDSGECHAGSDTAFRDFLNHELRTPLTAAGTALQTLAMQMQRAGGQQSRELLDIALRNIRRLEQTVDWACDFVADDVTLACTEEEITTPLTALLEDLDSMPTEAPMMWSTGPGEWDAPVLLDRKHWRRLLKQVLRAVGCQGADSPFELELNIVSQPGEELPSGLLLTFTLAPCTGAGPVQRTGSTDEAEHLRRLLEFTVSPDLSRRLDLRFDVARLSGRLRLRLMMPLQCPAETMIPA